MLKAMDSLVKERLNAPRCYTVPSKLLIKAVQCLKISLIYTLKYYM